MAWLVVTAGCTLTQSMGIKLTECPPDSPEIADSPACKSFCARNCSWYGGPQPGLSQIVRMTRITPLNVSDLDNKDEADDAGDLRFAIYEVFEKGMCRQDPHNYHCLTNGTGRWLWHEQVFMQWDVEVDGRWGPYMKCNPDVKSGKFVCGTYNNEEALVCGNCSAVWKSVGVELRNSVVIPPAVPLTTECALAFERAHCDTIKPAYSGLSACEHCVKDNHETLVPACRRNSTENETVVVERLEHHCESLYNAPMRVNDKLGGYWYNTPSTAKCGPTQRVGEGGCSWKAGQAVVVKNATCVMGQFSDAVVRSNPGCFSKCPDHPGVSPSGDGVNLPSDCWLDCWGTSMSMLTRNNLTTPFEIALNSTDPKIGGCPNLASK